MKISVKENLDLKSDCLALGIFEDDPRYYQKYNKDLDDEMQDALSSKAFSLEFGSAFSTKISQSAYKRIFVVALGKRNEFSIERLRRAFSRIVGFCKSLKYKSFTANIASLAFDLKIPDIDLGRASAESLILSEYSFEKYKSDKVDGTEMTAVLKFRDSKDFLLGMAQGRIIAESTNYAKDLVNEPSNVVTPEYIEAEAKRLVDKRIRLTVLKKKDLEKLGLNVILSVNKASSFEPRLIMIEYKNNGNEKYTAIVGKGITFDSGGYDVKAAGQFADMKMDMAGAAAVLGTMKAAARLDLKKNILGVIATTENMIDGFAAKPGDIIRAYNGKTIEIVNTDAEGRLILADAISYAEKNYSPAAIIDIATLTGACVVALGYYASGLFSNDDALAKKLFDAGQRSYDRVWQMPMFEDYQDNMDGEITDLKNMSNKPDQRAAGAITAAVFISKFVDKARWAHIDIAGPAFLKEAKDYNQRFATGAGVRLLTYYFMGE